MALNITCEACGTVLPVSESLVGRAIKCRTCGTQVTVSAGKKPVSAKPPAAKPLPAGDDDGDVFDAEMIVDEPPPPRATDSRAVKAVRRPAEAAPAPVKKSAWPLLVAVAVGSFVVVGGGAVAVIMAMQGDTTDTGTDPAPAPVVARNPIQPEQPIGERPPADRSKARMPADGVKTPPKKPNPTPTPEPTEPAEPMKTTPAPAVMPAPATVPVVKTEQRPDPATKTADPPVVPKRDRLDPAVLEQLTRSTVYLEVDDGTGNGSSGSGWFGVEPGLIVTNAHVIGMKLPGSKEPAKITAILDSGVPGKQRQYEGQKVKVLAVDRDMDLAVLQIVNEKDLPPPMPIKPSTDLKRLDPLVALGFPGGRRLSERNRNTGAPAITVTQTQVSAFRNDEGGNRYSIQIQGGVVHGNSGGPIVDTDGTVVGVAVRVDINPNTGQMTNIAYAVPAEYVTGMMAGRAVEAEVRQPYHQGDRVVFPIAVRCADAQGKLRAVGVGTWVGNADAGNRPAGDVHQEVAGDVGYREVPLKYDPQRKVATGTIDFPKEADGRAYWVQPYFGNAVVKKRYTAGVPIKMPSPPVDRVTATLTPKYAAGDELKVRVIQKTDVTERSEVDGKETYDKWALTQDLRLTEAYDKPKMAADLAQVALSLRAFGIEYRLKDAESDLPQEVLKVKDLMDQSLTRWGAAATIGRNGAMTGLNLTTSTSGAFGTDAVKRELLARLSRQILHPVQDSLIPLPPKAVNAGETWTTNTPHRFVLSPTHLFTDPPAAKGDRRGHMPREEMTYTYLGKRDKNGRGQLVIQIDGVLKGNDDAPCGVTTGLAVVEEQTGTLVDLRIKREFDLDTSVPGMARKSLGVEEFTVTRER
jgi:S1-C subfamily serine protease